jgi:hypothetical protein
MKIGHLAVFRFTSYCLGLTLLALLVGCAKNQEDTPKEPQKTVEKLTTCNDVLALLGDGTTVCYPRLGGNTVAFCFYLLAQAKQDRCDVICLENKGLWRQFANVNKHPELQRGDTFQADLLDLDGKVSVPVDCIVMR